MRRLIVVGIALGLISCTESSGPTNPAPVPTTTSVAQSAPTPEATPQPVVAEPTIGGPGPVSYEGHKCEGSLFNRAPHSRTVHVRYTAPLDNSTIYLETTFLVQGKSHKAVPSAQVVFEAEYDIPEPSCEPWNWSKRVQCDFTAGQGEHLAGQFVDVALSVPAIKGETSIEEGPWGECPLLVASTVRACYECRTVTEKFCDQEPTITTEKREIDCPCIDPIPPTVEPGLHCRPLLGSTSSEAAWFGPGAVFVKKVQPVPNMGYAWTSDGFYDIALMKGGNCDGGKKWYMVHYNVVPGQILTGPPGPAKAWSHISLFNLICSNDINGGPR